MNRLIRARSVWALVALVVLVGPGTSPVAAQDLGVGDRITIMVPDLAPMEGADNDFGEDVAEDLRDLINDLQTHEAVERDDIVDARRENNLAHERLFECITSRQLAMRMGWGLVLCGEYRELGNDQVQMDARFVVAQTGDEFEVPQFTADEGESEQAAQVILETFDRWTTQLRHTVFCQDYIESEAWDRALENCNQALAINQASKPALYRKALILREMDRPEEALEALDQLLEQDPIHQDALMLAGIAATDAAMPERARGYFDRYMQLNPGDVGVRLTVATDIANAGDPASAMAFAQEGLETAPNDTTLITYIGHFAAQAAARGEMRLNQQNQQGQQAQQEVPTGGMPGVSTEDVSAQGMPVDSGMIRGYYETAAESYQWVFDQLGAETEPQILQRLIVSQFKLGRYDEAVELGAQAVELDPENPALWEAYSRALQEAGQSEEALAAIERTQELGRSSAALTQRKAMLQLEMGQNEAAVATLVDAVEAGNLAAPNAFNIVFRNAVVEKFQQQSIMGPAYTLLEAAGPLAQSEEHRLARNFWRGYILYEQAKVAHEPQTAEAAARAKPMFEQALELFQAAQGYQQYLPSANVPQMIQASQQYIQIDEALIRRGQ